VMKCVLALLALCVSHAASQYLKETPFNQIAYGQKNSVVVLYWLNDPTVAPASQKLLDDVENVAKVLAPKYPQIVWVKCDAAEHYTDALQAQIEKKMIPIIVISIDGMVRLEAEHKDSMTEQTIGQIIVDGFSAPPPTNDVFGFASEQVLLGVSQQVPNIVRFHMQSCQFSRGMDKAWKRSASAYKGRVQFVDVDCLRDKTITAFCDKHSILASPKIMWFHAGTVVPYNGKIYVDAALNGFIDSRLATAPGGAAPPPQGVPPQQQAPQGVPPQGAPPQGQYNQGGNMNPNPGPSQGGSMNPNPGAGAGSHGGAMNPNPGAGSHGGAMNPNPGARSEL